MGTQGSMQTAGAALNCLPLHSFALCVPPPEHLEEGAWWGKRTHCCEDWEVRLPARRGPASKQHFLLRAKREFCCGKYMQAADN